MNNDGKKIAFSFSKVKKNALVNKVSVEPKEKIEYVDCFDGSKGKFSFKGAVRNNGDEKVDLVIPMPVSRTSTDIVKSRIEEKANRNNKAGGDKSESTTDSQNVLQNIDILAAQEILNEINNDGGDKKNNSLVIETKELPQEASDTDIDYDNIPVTDFGLAMLRGMGWRPDLGIGKEPRLVEAAAPKLRPKGLGLGAQPMAETNNEKKEGEKRNEREKEKEKYHERQKEREKHHEREKEREKYHEREKEREKYHEREKERSKSSHSDRKSKRH